MYDKDGSGTIELSEMVEILETVYILEGVTSDNNMARLRAKQIFAELDINGDGSLTCDEFIAGCMKDDDMVQMLQNNSLSDEDESTSKEDHRKKTNQKQRAAKKA